MRPGISAPSRGPGWRRASWPFQVGRVAAHAGDRPWLRETAAFGLSFTPAGGGDYIDLCRSQSWLSKARPIRASEFSSQIERPWTPLVLHASGTSSKQPAASSAPGAPPWTPCAPSTPISTRAQRRPRRWTIARFSRKARPTASRGASLIALLLPFRCCTPSAFSPRSASSLRPSPASREEQPEADHGEGDQSNANADAQLRRST